MPRPSSDASTRAPRSAFRRWGRWLLLFYLALLALSHLVRRTAESRADAPLPPGMSAVELAAVAGEETTAERVRLAWAEWGSPERPVVLLLHGSPGKSTDFRALGPLLGERFRVIAPDLPGFGRSSRRVPDYSIRAHAFYALALADELGVDRFHAVGFSMGGGVALHLADRAPRRVLSLTLLSAIGLQEFELLGQYHLNHAVHGLQLAGLWLLYEAVPHFGVLDGGLLDVPYARNFYDTDQRPLAAILDALEMPVLILHGEHDVLVSVQAAREHHRRVPQSELALFDANHFMVFRRPGELAAPLADFVERVEAGAARRRADATAERRAAAAEPRRTAPRIHGFALAVWMLLVAAATLVSEDLTCIAAGLVVARGRIELFPAVVACAAGIFVGDLALYVAGRLGRPWLERAPLRWVVRPEGVERSRRWFEQRGGWVILASRFLPGTRLPTYVAAGLLRMSFWWFTVMLLVPVALWTPILVGAAQLFGERAFARLELFERYALPGFVTALLAVWTALLAVRTLSTYRGRRLLAGWWRRTVQWEFWPPWAFYPPVVAYALWLGLRHRRLTLFTAADPGMPAAGGFIGESKAEILSRLDPRWVARFHLLPAGGGERRAAVRAFQRQQGLGYPLVLKPDRGQRGAGVTIARGDDDVEAFLTAERQEAIVQEYVAGPELGIFYVRRPGEARGRIFSITEKRLPAVTGDGRRTLERLILDDPRAVATAGVYFRALGRRIEEVPARGEEVRLVEIGTHCRGAVFLDGGHLLTPALEEAVDRVGRSFAGFYFGRFDFRAPSLAAFREGRDLKVLELNGVTSEATHVYDPKHRLRDAWRILFDQWRLAFEIGARNRERGVEPASLREVLRLLYAFHRGR